MNDAVARHPAASITPDVETGDALLDFWLGQVSLRLRREIAWCWFQRTGHPEPGEGTLPPLADSAADALDLVRYDRQKQAFFEKDVTARYLSEAIAHEEPVSASPERGSLAWLSAALSLDEVDRFVLALALLTRLDAAIGPVISACMNDLSRPWPTLALAQRLWDESGQVATLGNPSHPLRSHAVLRLAGEESGDWQQPLQVASTVAEVLIRPGRGLPTGLQPLVEMPPPEAGEDTADQAARLAARPPSALQIVPLMGPRDSDVDRLAASLGAAVGRPVVGFAEGRVATDRAVLSAVTVCWLKGRDLLLPEGWEHYLTREAVPSLLRMPVRCYAPVEDGKPLDRFSHGHLLPVVDVPATDYATRRHLLLEGLGRHGPALAATAAECARRFRIPPRALRRVVDTVTTLADPGPRDLIRACQQEALLPLDQLAQRVEPRFGVDELILPQAQHRQYREIIEAMNVLTAVHYQWGTARAWNESGLAVMFAGPPGTGKTMAAEALAGALELPMYRVDLSQVVNKYIGETEKNLKRLFDAAETSDCLMFFDECDALFGKRTEVRDAHDRFANIEISYLLERMERFKGLAVLATNRRRDLDDAFVRRLRYIIEFPIPGPEEREKIWRQGFPGGVDTEAVDFPYLGKQFQLTGGYIRSIAFNACLLAASRHGTDHRRVEMPEVLVALHREMEKMNRATGREQFGRYGDLLKQTLEESVT